MSPLARGALYGLVIITVLMTITAWSIWFERKFAGRMQSRLGPTMVGPAGLLQPLADALKLLQKESIIPASADRLLFRLAPPLTVLFALGTAAVIPFSPEIIASDLDVGVLFILALGGLLLFPVFIAGWSSNNKYSLLGAMRAVAQGISYEIPLVLAALVPVILSGSMRLSDIVRFQAAHGWFVVWPPGPGLFAFVLFFLAALAEANRIPFDIPEAESELVAGVTTEYTGMQFGLFYLSEYLHTLIVSAVAAALFLGGWDGPLRPGLHWMVLKTLVLFASIFWIRWTLLRFRADQLMSLCWKYLVPGGLALVMAAAGWVGLGWGAP
ncbi:MAG: NADH-quinone oxidoreductase subunit NuoH [Sorangiineae bacterium]|nr:NADH-quinone oxidoreductase subunit NuoH [Polyangiaceae bacterium]MEB2321555.1 NADH-quinone oxidoreductase subunit NuoH [Sorangiineae bacterium]